MAWDCQGNKSVFSHKREFSSLELPRGTVLEVELVSEMTGEVHVGCDILIPLSFTGAANTDI